MPMFLRTPCKCNLPESFKRLTFEVSKQVRHDPRLSDHRNDHDDGYFLAVVPRKPGDVCVSLLTKDQGTAQNFSNRTAEASYQVQQRMCLYACTNGQTLCVLLISSAGGHSWLICHVASHLPSPYLHEGACAVTDPVEFRVCMKQVH